MYNYSPVIFTVSMWGSGLANSKTRVCITANPRRTGFGSPVCARYIYNKCMRVKEIPFEVRKIILYTSGTLYSTSYTTSGLEYPEQG